MKTAIVSALLIIASFSLSGCTQPNGEPTVGVTPVAPMDDFQEFKRESGLDAYNRMKYEMGSPTSGPYCGMDCGRGGDYRRNNQDFNDFSTRGPTMEAPTRGMSLDEATQSLR